MEVVHIITTLENGGAEGALYRLVVHSKHEIKHVVISMRGLGRYGRLLKDHGITVETIDLPKGRLSLSGCFRLINILRKINRTAVVQTWMYHADLVGGIVARILGFKAVFWGIRNYKLDDSAKHTKIVAKLCARLSTYIPIGINSCSAAAAEYHRQLGYRSKWCVVPNGYPLKELDISEDLRNDFRSQLGIEDMFVMGFVARWDPLKDHKKLFEAVRMWAAKYEKVDYRLLLIGRGCDGENSDLASAVSACDLSDKVMLLGQRSDISAVMNGLDLHVLSSKSEAFPNVLAEAMACGTPCVATNVGDAAEIIGNNGWLVPPDTAQSLSKGIEEAFICLRSAKGSAELALLCRERIVDKYSMARMVSTFQKVWSGSV